jgi:hypothetical protein
MDSLSEMVDVVIGVDTHVDSHSAAPLDARTGGVLAEISVEANPDGYETLAQFQEHLATAGLRVTTTERHDQALTPTIDQIQTSLRALKILDLPQADSRALVSAATLAGKAADVVARGDAGYFLMVAELTSRGAGDRAG